MEVDGAFGEEGTRSGGELYSRSARRARAFYITTRGGRGGKKILVGSRNV